MLEPIVSTGQLALTIYIGHVLVGMAILEQVGRLENQTLSFAVTTASFSARRAFSSHGLGSDHSAADHSRR